MIIDGGGCTLAWSVGIGNHCRRVLGFVGLTMMWRYEFCTLLIDARESNIWSCDF
jgi:hypothetical protein